MTKKNGAIQLTKVWFACDVGTALDPGNIEAQMVGGTIYGLSAALYGEISFNDGEVQQFNFPDYEALRMANSPNFTVKVLENKPLVVTEIISKKNFFYDYHSKYSSNGSLHILPAKIPNNTQIASFHRKENKHSINITTISKGICSQILTVSFLPISNFI